MSDSPNPEVVKNVYFASVDHPGAKPLRRTFGVRSDPPTIVKGERFAEVHVDLAPDGQGVYTIPANDPYRDDKLRVMARALSKRDAVGRLIYVGPANDYADVLKMKYEGREKTADEKVDLERAKRRDLELENASLAEKVAMLQQQIAGASAPAPAPAPVPVPPPPQPPTK